MNSPSAAEDILVTASELTRIYPRGRERVHALHKVSFEIGKGQFVAVVGPSGSGKTTLLNLVGCMDSPSSGALRLFGNSAEALDDRRRTQLRREHVGFVFQHFGLLPTLSVAENIALPALFAGRSADGRIDGLLEKMRLTPRRSHRPHELSGGEMQRCAIARALINKPGLLLADEPTGNLDAAGTNEIIELFQELNQDGLTIIVVTHNQVLAAAAHRQIQLSNGRLV